MTFLEAEQGTDPAPEPVNAHRRLARIAHRAGNDRQFLQRAIEAKVDWIELDLWYSHGRLLAHHERAVWRLPLLYDTWRVRVVGERRLDLAEIVRLTDGGIGLFIDLKGAHPRLPGAIVDTLRRLGAVDRAIVCGQHWPPLDAIAAAEPAIRVFHSLGRPKHVEAYSARRPDLPRAAGLAVSRRLVTPELVERWNRRGLQVFAWTVNEQVQADQLAGWGVDGIISDRLEVLHSLA